MATIKKTGQWIMLTYPPNTEIPLDKFSIFYAIPKGQYLAGSRQLSMTEELRWESSRLGLSLDDMMDLIWKHLNEEDIDEPFRAEINHMIDINGWDLDDFESVVEILTPAGAVKIFPEEFSEISLEKALKLVEGYPPEEGSHVIRYFSNTGQVSSKIKRTSVSDKLFYLQSRGVSFTQAMKMIQGEIKTQHLMFFDPLPHYVEAFERDYLRKAQKKIDFWKEKEMEDLLDFGRYHINDFIQQLTKQKAS